MDIKVTVAGKPAPHLGRLVTSDLVMPLALVGSALGLDACWDPDSSTLQLASPLQGRVVVVDVASFNGSSIPVSEEMTARIEDIGRLLCARLRGLGANATLVDRSSPGGGAHLEHRADLWLSLAAGLPGRDMLPGPAARWGWAEGLISRGWAKTLVSNLSLHLGIAPRASRPLLSFWRDDYPAFLRWGGCPAIVVEPVNGRSQAGRKALALSQWRADCAAALAAGLASIFSQYLPAIVRQAGSVPGTVDFESLEPFWATGDQQFGDSAGGDAEPSGAAAEDQPTDPVDEPPGDDQEPVPDGGDDADGPGRENTLEHDGDEPPWRRSRVRIRETAGIKGPGHSSLASAVRAGKKTRVPVLPSHLSGNVFAAARGGSAGREGPWGGRRRRARHK